MSNANNSGKVKSLDKADEFDEGAAITYRIRDMALVVGRIKILSVPARRKIDLSLQAVWAITIRNVIDIRGRRL